MKNGYQSVMSSYGISLKNRLQFYFCIKQNLVENLYRESGMAKLNLEELTKKHFNTAAKIKKIPRYKDDYVLDLIGIFEYIDKVTENSTPGGVIKDFLILKNLANTEQQEILERLAETYYSYYSYMEEIEHVSAKLNFERQREGMSKGDLAREFSEETGNWIIKNWIGWMFIAIPVLILVSCINNMEEPYNHPACEALGMKSTWNNKKCY
jgi:hypothetical protein